MKTGWGSAVEWQSETVGVMAGGVTEVARMVADEAHYGWLVEPDYG